MNTNEERDRVESMKLHRFFTDKDQSLDREEVTISSPEIFNQMRKVLRLQTGEKVILLNGDGSDYVSTIVSYQGKSDITFHIEEAIKNETSPNQQVHLFFSIIKKDNVEWILQKGTELGISHFTPILSTRTEKKDLNKERAEKIILEATEQSGRGFPPTLHEVTRLEKVFDEFDAPLVVFQQGKQRFSQDELKNETRIGILIGPEGGWTPEEMEMFEKKKAIFRSLNSATLRAETAAIAAASLLLL